MNQRSNSGTQGRDAGGSPWGKVISVLALGAVGWLVIPADWKAAIRREGGQVLEVWAQHQRAKEVRARQELERRLKETRLQSVLRNALTPLVELPRISSTVSPTTNTPKSPVALAPSLRESAPDPASEWLRVIPHPSTVLVLGGKGSGKSAFAWGFLETSKHRAKPYAMGLPRASQRLAPTWIGHVPTIEDVPLDCTVLVDEAYIQFHARESSSASAKAVSRAVNLSRQRGQTLIFVSQEGRQVDRSIVSGADVIVFKDPGMLQSLSDRPELRAFAAEAKEAFEHVIGDKRGWAYVVAPAQDFKGLLPSPLPSFFTPSLSRAFAGPLDPGGGSQPEPVTLEDRIQVARRMSAEGRSYGEIGRALGVSRATAYNYVRGYPYRDQDRDPDKTP